MSSAQPGHQYARGIVIHDGKLLVMKRQKQGRLYYTLLGGEIEPEESPATAVEREILEEASIEVTADRMVFEEHTQDFGDQFIFLCTYKSGEPKLAGDSIEAWVNQNSASQDSYEPMWVELAELASLPFLSEPLKVALLDAFASDFPEETKVLASN